MALGGQWRGIGWAPWSGCGGEGGCNPPPPSNASLGHAARVQSSRCPDRRTGAWQSVAAARADAAMPLQRRKGGGCHTSEVSVPGGTSAGTHCVACPKPRGEGTVVPLLPSAAPATRRPSHASAGDASHSVRPKTAEFGGCPPPPHLMWGACRTGPRAMRRPPPPPVLSEGLGLGGGFGTGAPL